MLPPLEPERAFVQISKLQPNRLSDDIVNMLVFHFYNIVKKHNIKHKHNTKWALKANQSEVDCCQYLKLTNARFSNHNSAVFNITWDHG